MFKNLKLSKKIGGGFGLVLVLTAIVGYVGYSSLSEVTEFSRRLNSVNNTIEAIGSTRTSFLKYLTELEENFIDDAFTNVDESIKNADNTIEILSLQKDIDQLTKIRDAAKKYKSKLTDYVTANKNEIEIAKRRVKARGDLTEALNILITSQSRNIKKAEKEQAEILADIKWKVDAIQKDLYDNINVMRIASLKYSESFNATRLQEVKRAYQVCTRVCDSLREKFKNKHNLELIDDVLANMGRYVELTESYGKSKDDPAAMEKLSEEAGVAAVKMTKACNEILTNQDKKQDELAAFVKSERERREYNKALIDGINNGLVAVRGDLFKYITYKTKDLRKIVEDNILVATKKAAELQDRYANNSNLPKVNAAATAIDDYYKAFVEFADSLELKMSLVEDMGVIGKTATVEAAKAVESQEEQMRAIVAQANWSITIGSLIAIALGIGLSLFIASSITKPVSKMASGLALVADGDLTARVDVDSKDEIGMMATALNNMVDGLGRIVFDIREAADQTAASGEELSAAAQNISSGAQQQASSVEEIAASVEELTASINQVAENAQDANNVSMVTTETAEKGGEIVNQSVDGMKLINDSSSQISKIIGVISQIANQTNLLALNAAIEAASAGEHGMGFAVVADEVRKLAERSSQAAQEITQLIEESTKRVSDGSRLSEEVGGALREILDGIQKTSGGVEQISIGTGQQANTANEVSKAIEGISAITEENSSGAEEMAASAEELSAQAQRMQSLVEKFRVENEGNSTGSTKIEEKKPSVAPQHDSTEHSNETNSSGSNGVLYHS
jgi:methyl-accepting chemotaxis protein